MAQNDTRVPADLIALGPPPRWLKCPRKGMIIADAVIPFKVPLNHNYDHLISEQYRFNVNMMVQLVEREKRSIGLWVDLTNTNRFYDKSEVVTVGARYHKLKCRGFGECPSREQTGGFIELCRSFIKENPQRLIGVHCTHGYNRTGFLICAYLITVLDWSLDAALSAFAAARPPGIYKQEYIDELTRRYGDEGETPRKAPALPDWCDESEPTLNEDEADAGAQVQRSSATQKELPQFQPPLRGVAAVADTTKMRRLQKRCQELCGWSKHGFAGSQPVSIDRDNIQFLAQAEYMVSWKADGTRYLMLVDGEQEVYMFDRDNSVFHVQGLRFPARVAPGESKGPPVRFLHGTLVDGELVVDHHEGKALPRYLIYDIVHLGDKAVGQLSLRARFDCIRREIIEPRNVAKEAGWIDAQNEPFGVRMKQFGVAADTEKYLSEKFLASLPHELDGLIFQPVNEPYVPGRCKNVLKWKPGHLNSVDFKLRVERLEGLGMVRETVGYLYVLGMDQPFAMIKPVTKQLDACKNKVIECKFENGRWVFMRERKDKSFPNSFETAQGVCKSIQDPVTKEFLIDFVRKAAAAQSNLKRPHQVSNGTSQDGGSARKAARMDHQ